MRQESETTRIVAVRCFRVSEVGSKGVALAVQVQLKPVEMRVAVVVSVVDRQVRPVPGTPCLQAGKSNTRQKLAFDTQWPSEFFCCFRKFIRIDTGLEWIMAWASPHMAKRLCENRIFEVSIYRLENLRGPADFVAGRLEG